MLRGNPLNAFDRRTPTRPVLPCRPSPSIRAEYVRKIYFCRLLRLRGCGVFGSLGVFQGSPKASRLRSVMVPSPLPSAMVPSPLPSARCFEVAPCDGFLMCCRSSSAPMVPSRCPTIPKALRLRLAMVSSSLPSAPTAARAVSRADGIVLCARRCSAQSIERYWALAVDISLCHYIKPTFIDVMSDLLPCVNVYWLVLLRHCAVFYYAQWRCLASVVREQRAMVFMQPQACRVQLSDVEGSAMDISPSSNTIRSP